jgi:hypothetical protein
MSFSDKLRHTCTMNPITAIAETSAQLRSLYERQGGVGQVFSTKGC